MSKEIPYQRVEYLESSGVQFIKVDHRPATDSVVYVEGLFGVSPNAYSGRKFFFSDGIARFTHYNEVNATMQYGGAQTYTSAILTKGALYEANALFEPNGATYRIVVNGLEYTSSSSFASSGYWGSLLLFRIDNQYNGDGVRIGKCKIISNSEIVRDFYPVRIGDVGYMYDKVSKQLFGNDGSGSFVLGNDI